MKEVWDWFKIVLVIGGIVFTLIGMLWYRTGDFADFFGYDLRPEKGFWVMIGGAAMFGIGMALFYFGL
jgi:hypothetical protein